jgi:deoxycytidylate deaminase
MTCAKQTTIAVIKNGVNFWVGSNWCENPQETCPRKGLETGVGYELCKSICGQQNHAEVDACLKAGENARGADLFLIGHYYCCDGCKAVMNEHGIKSIRIFDGAAQ